MTLLVVPFLFETAHASDPKKHSNELRSSAATHSNTPCPRSLDKQLEKDTSEKFMPLAASSCANTAISSIARAGRLEKIFADNPLTTLKPTYPTGYLYRCMQENGLNLASSAKQFNYISNFYYVMNAVSSEQSKSMLARASLNRLLGKNLDEGIKTPDSQVFPKAFRNFEHLKFSAGKCKANLNPLKRTTLQGFAALQQYALLEASKSKISKPEKQQVDKLLQSLKSGFPWLASESFKDLLELAVEDAEAGKTLDEKKYLREIQNSIKLSAVASLGSLDDLDRSIQDTHQCILSDNPECFEKETTRKLLAAAEPFGDLRTKRKEMMRLSVNQALDPEDRKKFRKRADAYAELGPVMCQIRTRSINKEGNQIAEDLGKNVFITAVTAGVGSWAALGSATVGTVTAARSATVLGRSAALLRTPAGLSIAAGLASSMNIESFGAASAQTYQECTQAKSSHFASSIASDDNNLCSGDALNSQLMAVEEARSCGLAALANAAAALPFLGPAVPALAAQVKKLIPKRLPEMALKTESIVLKNGEKLEIPLLQENGTTITQQAYDLADDLRKKVGPEEMDEVIQKLESLSKKYPAGSAVSDDLSKINGHYFREASEKLKGAFQHRRLSELSPDEHQAVQALGAETFVELATAGVYGLDAPMQKSALECFEKLTNFYASSNLPDIPPNLPKEISSVLEKLRSSIRPMHEKRFAQNLPSTEPAKLKNSPPTRTASTQSPSPLPQFAPQRGTSHAYEVGSQNVGNEDLIEKVAALRAKSLKKFDDALESGNMDAASTLGADYNYFAEVLEVLTGLPGDISTKLPNIKRTLNGTQPGLGDKLTKNIQEFRTENPEKVVKYQLKYFNDLDD